MRRKALRESTTSICSRIKLAIKTIEYFEALNIFMIIAVFIDLGLKYSYD